MTDENRQLNNIGGQVSIDEMASNTLIAKREARNAFLKKAKKLAEVVGYEYKPYYNRPKKGNLGKLSIVIKNPLNGIIYRRLVAQNVPTKECIRFIQITDLKELKKIHKDRSKKVNYGFQVKKKKKKPIDEDE